MGDPFSIAAGVVGILAPTVHYTRVLLDDLQNIFDAPEVVEDLKGDLRSVHLTLESLRAVKEAEWAAASPSTLEQSKMIITSCKDSCTKLKADLDRWTRHSSSGRLSWQDRAIVGFWKQSRIKSMSKQLQKYQIALNLVASTATLHYSIRGKPISEEMEDAISKQEAEITNSITAADRQLATINTQLDASANGTTNDEGDDEHEAMEIERAALQQSLKLLEELKKSNEDEARKIAGEEYKPLTRISFGNNNAGFQLGTNSGPISGITFGFRD
ncbi:hypothetical protein M434DRAFT_84320 [Hypoxylon sp. CO27-5]|nr:hypothetical protein M434DRAFT_84320 [Hypoxylon sp. CO27-5]